MKWQAAMRVTPFSSPEFNQNIDCATMAAQDGPVFITDGGRPTHVLLTIEEYLRLAGDERSIVDKLAMLGHEEIDVDFPHSDAFFKPANVF